MKRVLLIIDPQNSFCDPAGELFVEGANHDIARLTDFIETNGDTFNRIVVTLDSHNRMHIAHPVWWVDNEGNHPIPFTRLTRDEVTKGIWRAACPSEQAWSEAYMKACPTHMIWPPHCLMGTWGHEVCRPLNTILNQWAVNHTDLVLMPKGNARYTEHLSIFRPTVKRENDPASQFNTNLLNELNAFDEIYVAGEASSHCVAMSIRDLVTECPSMATRIVLLTDAMSPVTGFKDQADTLFQEIKRAGARTAITIENIEQTK